MKLQVAVRQSPAPATGPSTKPVESRPFIGTACTYPCPRPSNSLGLLTYRRPLTPFCSLPFIFIDPIFYPRSILTSCSHLYLVLPSRFFEICNQFSSPLRVMCPRTTFQSMRVQRVCRQVAILYVCRGDTPRTEAVSCRTYCDMNTVSREPAHNNGCGRLPRNVGHACSN